MDVGAESSVCCRVGRCHKLIFETLIALCIKSVRRGGLFVFAVDTAVPKEPEIHKAETERSITFTFDTIFRFHI